MRYPLLSAALGHWSIPAAQMFAAHSTRGRLLFGAASKHGHAVESMPRILPDLGRDILRP